MDGKERLIYLHCIWSSSRVCTYSRVKGLMPSNLYKVGELRSPSRYRTPQGHCNDDESFDVGLGPEYSGQCSMPSAKIATHVCRKR